MTNLLLFAADIGGDTMEKSGESSKDMADFINNTATSMSMILGIIMMVIGILLIVLAIDDIRVQRPAASHFISGLLALIMAPVLCMNKLGHFATDAVNKASKSSKPKPKPGPSFHFVWTEKYSLIMAYVLLTVLLCVLIYRVAKDYKLYDAAKVKLFYHLFTPGSVIIIAIFTAFALHTGVYQAQINVANLIILMVALGFNMYFDSRDLHKQSVFGDFIFLKLRNAKQKHITKTMHNGQVTSVSQD